MDGVEPACDGTTATVNAARLLARAAGATWGVPPDNIALVVEELVTNALVHAGGGFHLSLRLRESAVLVEVGDADPRLPRARGPGPADPGGLGLAIVDHLSRAWGARRRAYGGKVVWAELPTNRP